MSDKDKQILEAFKAVLPLLSPEEKDQLLAFGEGMAFKATKGPA